MRVVRQVGSLRRQLVRKTLVAVLQKQATRAYAPSFHVVHFSIQDDHLHLIVEAAGAKTETAETAVTKREPGLVPTCSDPSASHGPVGATSDARRHGAACSKAVAEDDGDALRRGVSGLAIALARRLNRLLHRRGRFWADRHHRRDLESPTQVRNTLVYVLQNHAHHGMKTFGAGLVDAYATAHDFDGWADPTVVLGATEPWRLPARTWLLRVGWRRGGGPIGTQDFPRLASSVRHAPIVRDYVPDATFEG